MTSLKVLASLALVHAPAQTAQMGVDAGVFDKVIQGALADHCHKTNPRPATNEDYRGMLEASM